MCIFMQRFCWDSKGFSMNSTLFLVQDPEKVERLKSKYGSQNILFLLIEAKFPRLYSYQTVKALSLSSITF